MALSPGPWVKPQYFDDNGSPAASYRLFFYDAGTSTKRDTYQDADQLSLNTNPVVLDSAGRANIFLLPTLYKIVYAAAGSDDPPSSPIWTVDDVGPSGGTATDVDVPITAGENLTLNDVVYLSSGSGGLTAGRWYKADADQTYSSTLAEKIGMANADITSGSTGTARILGQFTGLSGLTAGTVYFISATAGALTSSAPANARRVGVADSTTTFILESRIPAASAGEAGLVDTGAQSWEGVKTFGDQPLTYIGAATTLPATIGGVFVTDITQYSVPQNTTDQVLTSTTIPANMLNANGKAIRLRLGATTTTTSAVSVTIELNVGGTQVIVFTINASSPTFWSGEALLVRVSTTNLRVTAHAFSQSSANFIAGVGGATIGSLDFTAAITLQSLGTTGAGDTLKQDWFIAETVG